MEEAYGYTRISDDRDGKALGVGRQRQDIEGKASSLGWKIVGFFEDNDITADPKKKVRPAFQNLMTDMQSGKVKRVLCYDQDRLCRDMRELEDVVDAVEAGGVLLTSVNGDIDLLSDNGRFVARMKGALAKAELEKISRRVKRKQLEQAQAGQKHQGKYRVFGYDRQMQPIPAEAAAVKDAFTRKAKGESLTSIATILNRDFKTTGGGHWDASAVSKMIRRRDYVGEITIKGEVVGKAAFDPIVDRAVFDLANAEADANNRRGKNTRKGLLSGFLVCGNCTTKMKRGGNADGPNYRCPGPLSVPGSCGSCSIGAPHTDLAIFNAAWQKEQNEEPSKPDAPVRDFKAELAAIQTEIEQTHALRQSGALLLVDAVPILTDLRSKLAKVQREEAATVQLDLGFMQTFLDWEHWDLSEQRTWLDRYIAYVEVAKADRIGIKGFKPQRLTVHFRDGTVRSLPKPTKRTDGVRLEIFNGEVNEIPFPLVKTCSEDGCDKKVEAKGLCATHYKAHRRAARAALLR